MKKIGVLGSGAVGQVLADGFLKHGYGVMRGSRDPAKLTGWQAAAGDRASVGTFADAAKYADIAVLAVKGSAAEEAVGLAGVDALAGKPVLDATNPLADAPPVKGVLQVFTGPNESLMERLQKRAPAARFVKAFSCTGSPNFVNPDFGATRPTMFICGDDAAAKEATRAILDQFGWDTADMGGVEAARAIEPLCVLWCIRGFVHNEWTHAFKLLKR
jgi:predicted dinucleotide-binding enzyme